MGRKNWESLPDKFRPLPHRINAVISRDNAFSPMGCSFFPSIESAIKWYQFESDEDIFIVGGGQIYNYAIENDLVDEMLITCIDAEFEGDTWFPKIDDSKWTKSQILRHEKDEKNLYSFTVWNYKRKRTNS